MTPDVTRILAKTAPRLVGEFPDRRPPKEIRFGVGDILTVTIFEASTGGLFIPSEAGVRPGNFITIPNQAVDAQGNISIPYAGSIRAKGRTAVEVQQAIVDALKNRAIEPQVVVSTVAQNTSLITVLRRRRTPRPASGQCRGRTTCSMSFRAPEELLRPPLTSGSCWSVTADAA